MAATNEYQGVQFSGFDQGLNLHVDSSRLELTELSQAMNFRLGPRGELQLRTGYTRVDGLGGAPGTGYGRFLFGWRDSTGEDFLILVDGSGDLRYGFPPDFFDSGFDVHPGANLQDFGVGFAGARNKAYLSSKQESSVRTFDGAVWSTVSTIPNAKMLHYRHNRLFAINDDNRPSAIYFSALGDPESFATEDYIEVDPDDGYQLNASEIYGDDIIVFKDKALWKLSGRTPTSFALYRVDNERGCVSTQAIAQLRGRLFFYDRDTGVWAFDGANLELVSEPINDYILANQDYDQAWRASAYVGEDRFYLSIPWTGDDPDHQFVYFADTGAWTEYDTGFEGAVEFLSERYIGLPAEPGLYVADPESNNVPGYGVITGIARTGWQLLGGPGVKARIRRLEMTLKADEGISGTVRMYRDFDGETPYKVRSFVGGAAQGASVNAPERRVSLDGWGNKVHSVMFEFETADSPFQINQFTMFFTGGIDVRGER